MVIQIPVPVGSEGSDGKLVADFVPPKGRWTLGDMETDFPLSLLHTSIAAIILQPEPGEPPGDPEPIIEVNNPWEVDVRWEFNGRAACFINGEWRVKLFLESLGEDELDRESKYPHDIPVDGRPDSYHVQFKIAPNLLHVEPDEGTPFQLTVAVILMVHCGPNRSLVPGPVIGKVNLPLIQAFREWFLHRFHSTERWSSRSILTRQGTNSEFWLKQRVLCITFICIRWHAYCTGGCNLSGN